MSLGIVGGWIFVQTLVVRMTQDLIEKVIDPHRDLEHGYEQL